MWYKGCEKAISIYRLINKMPSQEIEAGEVQTGRW